MPERIAQTPAGQFDQHLRLLTARGEGALEVRAILPNGRVMSGYYSDLEEAVRDGLKATEEARASGVYVLTNPALDALRARGENRLAPAKRGGTTKDEEIARRHLYVLDVDPVRPSGISATDEEKAEAEQRARDLATYYRGRGLPDPFVIDSGNGVHLYYPVDLPADDGGLVARVLAAADAGFSDDAVHVDTSVSNASRIMKAAGTWARKGEDTEDRPHRRAQIVQVPEWFVLPPDDWPVVTRRQLEAEAALAPTNAEAGLGAAGGDADEIADALQAIASNVGRPDRALWLRLCGATKAACGGDVTLAQSLLIDAFGEEEQGEYEPILNYPFRRIGAGTLFYHARAAGWTRPKRTRQERRARQRSERVRDRHRAYPPARSVLDIRPGADWLAAVAGQPEPLPLWGTLWFEGETTILFSETNAGKSVLAVQVGEAIASGRRFPGFASEVDPRLVLYLDFELSGKQWERRYSDGFRDHYAFHPNFHRAELDPDALTDEDSFDLAVREAIEAAVVERGYRVVIVDNLTFLGRQSQEAKDALPLMRSLHRLKRTYGLSMLVLGHTPKRDGSRPLTLNDLGGSRHLANFADAVVGLGMSAREPNVRYLKQLKVRSAEMEYHSENVAVLGLEKPSNFLGFRGLDFGPEDVHLRDKTDAEKGQRDADIVDLHAEGESYREIATRLGISKNTAMKVIQKAREANAPSPGVPTRPPLQGTGTGTQKPNKDLGVPVPPGGTAGTVQGDGLSSPIPDLDVPEWGDDTSF